MTRRTPGRFLLAAGLVALLGVLLWAANPLTGTTSGEPSGKKAASSASAANNKAAPNYEVFPAGTGAEGQESLPEGQQLARYRMEDGVKVFELTALPVKWSTGDKEYEAWTFNGTVPGPQIRVKEGDRVRVVVKNRLPEPTVVHWHGLQVTNAMDGVPMVTQDPIPPGGEFVYEFVATPSGTHMYHSHYNVLKQEGKGLFGTLVVEPREPEPWSFDKEFSLMIADGELGYTINGKSFPKTTPIKLKAGETARFRWMNVGNQIHPMHLHGFDFKIVAKDGRPLPQPVEANTLDLMPGDTYDVLVKFDRPGTWAWHCHVISHVEDAKGNMTGLIQVIQVEE